ncbi:MAG: peptidoglycan-associated lipoprotein [Lysobacterales bacterium]|jgi:peptidoglycan-associated lipoprotein
MNIALRLLLALMVTVALAACKTTPEAEPVEPDTSTTPDTSATPDGVTTSAAVSPDDYTSDRAHENFEPGSGSLLSKRVIYFDFDMSNVKAEYRAIIAAHAAYAGSHSSARITLEGHADERGTREYNLGLGERRGNGVSGLLSAGGASGSQTSVVAYGEERPVCRVSAESCWQQNRRVEIVYTAR